MRILVTGAGGFIGGWVVEFLHLTGFGQVRAAVRRWPSAARIGRFPVETVLCDILNRGQVECAVEGVDAVVHCAYGPREVNIEGTENLLKASLRAGVGRFVHLSTIDVYGRREGSIDETSPFRYTGSEYGDSKIEAEKLCIRYSQEGFSLVVLRPTVVYGPHCKLWITKFAERLRSGKWGIFRGLEEGLCNLVYITDLIEAILLSLKTDNVAGQAFNINGGEVITWNEYFRRLNRALGFPELREIHASRSRVKALIMLPVRTTARYVQNHYGDWVTALYQRFDVARKMAKGTERALRAAPTPEELKMFGLRARYSISKARLLLGYEPTVGIDEGLEMSARWLRHESLLAEEDWAE
jgi:nucleoside-diphosphate-sugar epimerase